MAPATTGDAAVEVLYVNGCFQSSSPSCGFTETKPDCIKKIIWRWPRMVAAVGLACVIFSSCAFQTTLPSALSKAINDSPGPPPPTKTRLSSINGDAAFCQLTFRPACSLSKSCDQTGWPVCTSKHDTTSRAEVT